MRSLFNFPPLAQQQPNPGQQPQQSPGQQPQPNVTQPNTGGTTTQAQPVGPQIPAQPQVGNAPVPGSPVDTTGTSKVRETASPGAM